MPYAEKAARTPSTNSSALRGVAGRRRRDEPDPLGAERLALRGVVPAIARVRSMASGAMTPVRSTPWPSRTISIRRKDVDQ